MKCNRCGRENPSGVKRCGYCGSPMDYTHTKRVGPNNKNKKKTNESIIVAAILVAVLLVVIAVGFAIYKHNTSRKLNFGGSGGGSLPPRKIEQRQQDAIKSDGSSSEIEDSENSTASSGSSQTEVSEPPKKEVPEQKPKEKPSTVEPTIPQKDKYLNKAKEIEAYSANYLETAESQYEINSESSIVFEKWDDLLNDVYNYLKSVMSDSAFKRLQDDELSWIKEKEAAIEEAGAEWDGGSGEIAARNMTAIRYTKERCYYLISLIN